MPKTSIPIKLQKIGADGFHLLAELRINGVKVKIVVDTGASRTVFDVNLIRDLENKKKIRKHAQLSSGLGTNTMESQTLVLSLLELGSFQLKNYKTVLLDLSHVNSSYSALGIKPVLGVLGSDLLRKFKARISYANKKMILEK